MAGVLNKTARQFNVRAVCSKTKARVTVRLAPGFNVIPDEVWAIAKADKYVVGLKKDNHIDFGKEFDDMELERDADTKAKVKVSQPVTDKKD